MARYILTKRADADLFAIVRQGYVLFGSATADRYVRDLRRCFDLLAEQPEIGRKADRIRAGLRRHEHGRHVIFYRIIPDGIRVIAVLHRRQLAKL